ncbi:MAG: UDP-N-acetylmuramate dehydrogenase, partial [Ruminococcaceae bacterium]|nr:UDP-N-acetylmuramate dehydrogenase [Oscillospiraceae bacterium]
NGSNMLVDDNGIGGVVLRLDEQFCEITVSESGILRAGAGATLSAMCHAALDASLTGLEFAWGIPGSVGGAAFMNAGAYGGEMKDVVVSCEYITPDGAWNVYNADQCEFGYRTSVFQHQPYIITAVSVQLKPGDQREIRAQMDDILQRRKSKQPLELPSAGSVFKRPVGYYAGGLIEQCGLKGASVGGAQVSEKHAGFIVNKGGATCADVLGLVAHIQKTVLEQTGVTLECEIRSIS